jgi:hypothetical protein
MSRRSYTVRYASAQEQKSVFTEWPLNTLPQCSADNCLKYETACEEMSVACFLFYFWMCKEAWLCLLPDASRNILFLNARQDLNPRVTRCWTRLLGTADELLEIRRQKYAEEFLDTDSKNLLPLQCRQSKYQCRPRYSSTQSPILELNESSPHAHILESEGFWRWFMTLGITGLMDSIHRPEF